MTSGRLVRPGSNVEECGAARDFCDRVQTRSGDGFAGWQGDNIGPIIVRASDTQALMQNCANVQGNTLVVGHGNTIPDIAKAWNNNPNKHRRR